MKFLRKIIRVFQPKNKYGLTKREAAEVEAAWAFIRNRIKEQEATRQEQAASKLPRDSKGRWIIESEKAVKKCCDGDCSCKKQS